MFSFFFSANFFNTMKKVFRSEIYSVGCEMISFSHSLSRERDSTHLRHTKHINIHYIVDLVWISFVSNHFYLLQFRMKEKEKNKNRKLAKEKRFFNLKCFIIIFDWQKKSEQFKTTIHWNTNDTKIVLLWMLKLNAALTHSIIIWFVNCEAIEVN